MDGSAEGSDERAMAAVAHGDPAALAALYQRHHARIWAFFLRTTGSRPTAEELTHDVFLRILRYHASFKARRGGFVRWMYGVARNVLADHGRKPPPAAAREIDPDELASELPSPSAVLFATEERRRLIAALGRLEPAQREILVLAHFEGLSHRDIARLVGCSEGAVKLRVFRALRRLERLLRENHEPTPR